MPTAKVKSPEPSRIVERVQTGVRLEKRLLKVLKALATELDSIAREYRSAPGVST